MIEFRINAESPEDFASQLRGVVDGLVDDRRDLPSTVRRDDDDDCTIARLRAAVDQAVTDRDAAYVHRAEVASHLAALHIALDVPSQGRALQRIAALLEIEAKAVPAKPKRTRGNAPAPSETAAPSASASDAPPASSSPAASEPPALPPAEQPPAPAGEATPASDSTPVVTIEDVRALLSAKIKEGKQPEVNALVTSFAPALSKVPADKLAELAEKAKKL